VGFSYFDCEMKLTTAPARSAGAPRRLRDWVRSGEDEVCRVLRLGCGVDEKFAIREVSGAIRQRTRPDSR
jgi:hypothetical protein